MALITCPECGRAVSDKATACPNCGAPIGKKYCKYCGNQIDKDCVICPVCGKQVEDLRKDSPVYINNSASSSSSATAQTPPTVIRKLPWYLRGGWIFILGCITGGLYWIVGIILRIIWRSHN